jgi:hypothetical protein
MRNAGAAIEHEEVDGREAQSCGVKRLPTRKGKAEDGTLTDTKQGKVR